MIVNQKIGTNERTNERNAIDYFSYLCMSSMVDAITQLNSNQRLLRSQRKSSNSMNPPVPLPSPFVPDTSDPTMNFLSPSTYSLVNQNLANYSTDAFVYSQLSDLNYRTETSSTTAVAAAAAAANYHPIRMSPYARQAFYPMYTQREIHSPSSSSSSYHN